MKRFVCPECYARIRPHAFFVSRGETWWSTTREEASALQILCPHREVWPDGGIAGCQSMRIAIDAWLRGDRPAPGIGFTDQEVVIATIAVARAPVEARGDVPVPVPPEIGDSFRDPTVRAAFQCNPGSAAIGVFALNGVTLVAARHLLFHDGRRIAESRYLVSDADYWIDPPPPRETVHAGEDRTVVIGANLACHNYYHWMMQCLPAIEASLRAAGAEPCVLALPPLSDWQEESLVRLGLADQPRLRIERDRHYRFPRALWCGYLNGAAEAFVSPFCLSVLDRVAAGVPRIPDTPGRIYVARFDTRNRPIRNEDAVRRLLEGLGFVTVIPGSMPLAAQIALFRGANVIVGAHGAGLTNIAFCAAGTTVLELIQSGYPAVLINRIAQTRGLRYHAECFDSGRDGGPDVNQQVWEIDIFLLEQAVARLL